MLSFHTLLYIPLLYTGPSLAAASYNASSSTFDVFKYVNQLIGTNNYGKVIPFIHFPCQCMHTLFLMLV